MTGEATPVDGTLETITFETGEVLEGTYIGGQWESFRNPPIIFTADELERRRAQVEFCNGCGGVLGINDLHTTIRLTGSAGKHLAFHEACVAWRVIVWAEADGMYEWGLTLACGHTSSCLSEWSPRGERHVCNSCTLGEKPPIAGRPDYFQRMAEAY